jgi:GT2 family glycosyltransferase
LNCFIHRKAILNTIGGGFCEQMKRLVDWELVLRICESGQIYSVPVVLSNYYQEKVHDTITVKEELEPARKILMDRRNFGYQNTSSGKHALSKKVTIIIPNYESLDHLTTCMESLTKISYDPLVQIIVVDNNSQDIVVDYLRNLDKKKARVLFNNYNSGFSHAVNQGVQLSDPDSDILILQNDAQMTDGALGALQESAYRSENIALTVPQQVLSAGENIIHHHVPFADRDFPCDVALSSRYGNVEPLSLFHGGGDINLNYASFFCVYIKRQIWELCGGLDAYHGRHFQSDRIMCEFVRHVLEMRIVYTPQAVVFHHYQAATKALKKNSENDYEMMIEKNQWPDAIRSQLGFKKPLWEE